MKAEAVYVPEVRVRIDLKKTTTYHNMEIETGDLHVLTVRPDFLWVTYFCMEDGWNMSDLTIYGYVVGDNGRLTNELVDSGQYSPLDPPAMPVWMRHVIEEHTPVRRFPYSPFLVPVEAETV